MANPLRTLLWVPGNNRKKIEDAFASAADCVVLDLEDLVPVSEKLQAREMVIHTLKTVKTVKMVGVRINSWQSPYGMDDINAIVKAQPGVIRLPKCNTPDEMKEVDKLITSLEKEAGIPEGQTKVIVSIESALGIINVFGIASAAKRVIGLGLGVEDFTTDLKTNRTTKGLELELLFARSQLVIAARAAGIAAIDGAFLDFNDTEGLIAETQMIKQLGFDGKGIIHPSHAQLVNDVFAPSEQEAAFAEKVIQAFEQAEKDGSFYVFVDGKLVDPPVLAKAQRILAYRKEIV